MTITILNLLRANPNRTIKFFLETVKASPRDIVRALVRCVNSGAASFKKVGDKFVYFAV